MVVAKRSRSTFLTLADGSYVVDWRVVSSDSHPLHAAYTFQIGPDGTLAAGLLDQIISSSHTGGPASIGLTISRSLVIASIAVVFGGLLVCGLGIVPFGRRQRIVIGAVGGCRDRLPGSWPFRSRSATPLADLSA